MYVCICKAVTDGAIRQAAAEGDCRLRHLTKRFGLGSVCGRCVPDARAVLDEAQRRAAVAEPAACAARWNPPLPVEIFAS
jgi:bacterioferritin-associated ferredoxin